MKEKKVEEKQVEVTEEGESVVDMKAMEVEEDQKNFFYSPVLAIKGR